MAVLPPSTNDRYAGPRAAAWFLALMSLITIIPGNIHTFLPDGGAGVIAGRDLSVNGDTIVRLFAWAGATQIVWGFMLLLISLRYQSFVPLALGLLFLERCIHTWTMWGPKGQADGYLPPEAYVTLVLVPLLLGFFFLSLRTPREPKAL